MDILKDIHIPGGRFLRWVLLILIASPLVISFSVSDDRALSLSLKIMTLLLDALCLYIIFWIAKSRLLRWYAQVIMALSAIAIGETLMAFL